MELRQDNNNAEVVQALLKAPLPLRDLRGVRLSASSCQLLTAHSDKLENLHLDNTFVIARSQDAAEGGDDAERITVREALAMVTEIARQLPKLRNLRRFAYTLDPSGSGCGADEAWLEVMRHRFAMPVFELPSATTIDMRFMGKLPVVVAPKAQSIQLTFLERDVTGNDSKAVVETLQSCSSLTSLNLTGSDQTEFPIACFTQGSWPRLQRLRMFLSVTSDALSALSTALPALEAVHIAYVRNFDLSRIEEFLVSHPRLRLVELGEGLDSRSLSQFPTEPSGSRQQALGQRACKRIWSELQSLQSLSLGVCDDALLSAFWFPSLLDLTVQRGRLCSFDKWLARMPNIERLTLSHLEVFAFEDSKCTAPRLKQITLAGIADAGETCTSGIVNLLRSAPALENVRLAGRFGAEHVAASIISKRSVVPPSLVHEDTSSHSRGPSLVVQLLKACPQLTVLPPKLRKASSRQRK